MSGRGNEPRIAWVGHVGGGSHMDGPREKKRISQQAKRGSGGGWPAPQVRGLLLEEGFESRLLPPGDRGGKSSLFPRIQNLPDLQTTPGGQQRRDVKRGQDLCKRERTKLGIVKVEGTGLRAQLVKKLT